MHNDIPDLVHETAKIAWKELQRFYAQGKVLHVADELDLVQVATAFTEDNIDKVNAWTESALIIPVPDSQALQWYEDDALVWAVTVAPFVLVQSVISKH
jgi:hypothetical protein